ncbi:unnamed protein product [Ambrosiozyma monospora]|uniref:Unnamed protein product n=1 Tax=Ambrosiozyma monospora TaxID=43982 RepID=A0ACB5TUR6_AMBMO|nr:unnamed protein product [Ambrosiozyma monospora]
MFLLGFACSALSHLWNCLVLNPDIISFNPYLVAIGAMVGAFGMPVMSITNTYLADVVEPEQLTPAMGQMMAIMSVSMGMGPLFSSLLHLESIKLLQIGVCMSFIGWAAAFVLVRESRPAWVRERTYGKSSLHKKCNFGPGVHDLDDESVEAGNGIRLPASTPSPAQKRYRFGLQHIANQLRSFRLLWITRYDRHGNLQKSARINPLMILAIGFLMTLAGMGAGSCIVVYGTFMFHWDNHTIGLIMSTGMLSRAAVLLFLNPLLNKYLLQRFSQKKHRLDTIDRINIGLALASETLGMSVIVFARTTNWFYVTSVITAMGALGGPAFQSCLLKYNEKPEQNGEFFGLLSMLGSVVMMVAPVLFLGIYSATLEFNPVFVFELCVGIYAACGVAMAFLRS